MTSTGVVHSNWPRAFDELAGRRALITGSSTGIGAAVATALASCGVDVAIHYNSGADEAEGVCARIRAHGRRAFALGADLSEPGAAARLVPEAVEHLGGLDILVNNAGSILGRVPTETITPEFYGRIIDLNLNAVFFACQAAIAVFVAQGGGVIINTTSLAARTGGGPGTVAYAAAKAGVSTLTRGLAKEFASHGIRINAVAPGFISTPLHERHTAPQMMREFEKSIPMGRLGEADDCVGAYLFLACNTLSGYVTGQTIEVNGGLLMP